ncbi:MAG: hypothetical protein QM667_13675, partial [Asticcacaulis sp.]
MRFKALAVLCTWGALALTGMAAQASEMSAEARAAMRPVPELKDDMAAAFPDFLVAEGDAHILPGTAEVRVQGIFDHNTLLSLPVRFKAALRLETPVTATV